MAAVKSEGRVTVTFNSNNITQYCNSADLQAAIDRLEVTDLASTGKEYISGVGEWTISLNGYWDSTLDGYLGPEAVTPGTKRTGVIAFTDAASTTVTYTWTSNAEIQDYNITSAVGGAIEWSATLALTGAPSRS